jgi:hypothetical protein
MQISPEDFGKLARAMCAEDREATILAFSAAIVECIGRADS